LVILAGCSTSIEGGRMDDLRLTCKQRLGEAGADDDACGDADADAVAKGNAARESPRRKCTVRTQRDCTGSTDRRGGGTCRTFADRRLHLVVKDHDREGTLDGRRTAGSR